MTPPSSTSWLIALRSGAGLTAWHGAWQTVRRGAGQLGRRRRVRIGGVLIGLILAALLAELLTPGWTWLPTIGLHAPAAVILLVFLGALLCEFVDSSLGMGYGTTLAPLLLLAGFEPLAIVPAILLSECVTGLLSGLMHHRDGNVDLLRDRRARGVLALFMFATLLGVLVAVTLASVLPSATLAVVIAMIVLLVGVVVLATRRRRLSFRPGQMAAVGVVAAFNKAISGGGYGPLVTAGQVVAGLPARNAVAITSLSEGVVCLVGLVAYFLLGQRIDPGLAVPLLAGAVLSVPLATLFVRRMPEQGLRTAVGVATVILGGLALYKSLA